MHGSMRVTPLCRDTEPHSCGGIISFYGYSALPHRSTTALRRDLDRASYPRCTAGNRKPQSVATRLGLRARVTVTQPIPSPGCDATAQGAFGLRVSRLLVLAPIPSFAAATCPSRSDPALDPTPGGNTGCRHKAVDDLL